MAKKFNMYISGDLSHGLGFRFRFVDIGVKELVIDIRRKTA